jgi:hypothetical protein
MQDHRTRSAARIVLFALADQADQAGLCWPGYGAISRRTNVDRRTAIRAVAWLEAHGFLQVTRRPGDGNQHQSNLYRICIPGVGGEPGSPPSLPVAWKNYQLLPRHPVSASPLNSTEPSRLADLFRIVPRIDSIPLVIAWFSAWRRPPPSAVCLLLC